MENYDMAALMSIKLLILLSSLFRNHFFMDKAIWSVSHVEYSGIILSDHSLLDSVVDFC